MRIQDQLSGQSGSSPAALEQYSSHENGEETEGGGEIYSSGEGPGRCSLIVVISYLEAAVSPIA